MDLRNLKEQLIKNFGEDNHQEILFFFSPGRVNLMGGHIDYNGGLVFPCALSYGTALACRKNNKQEINFASLNFSFKTTIALENISKKIGNEWVNYPLGVISKMQEDDCCISGMDFLYDGNIPYGAGLSSSASIELVTAFAINQIFEFKKDRIDLIKISQKAENEFVGVNCGIMDQFIIGVGETDKAIALECDTLEYNFVPIDLKNYSLVISNTNKKRKLADSKYNERRMECEKVVQIISQKIPINFLTELTFDDLQSMKDFIGNEKLYKRAKHVVSENDRVAKAIKALKKQDLQLFGSLINASHDSLKNDYEVTGNELDTLVGEARKIDGVIGARMTGAGFGGCAISLVHKTKLDYFCDVVSKNYEKKIGYKPSFYFPEIGKGVREVFIND